MVKRKKTQVFCNICMRVTNHTCKGEHIHVLPEKLEDMDNIVEQFIMWVCDGCENATLEHFQMEAFLQEEEEEINAERGFYYHAYYPPQDRFLIKAKHFKQLSKKLSHLYTEILLAYNNQASVLCAVGIRAIIEGICADKEIAGINLKSQIDGLATLLPQNIIEGLHGIRFIGNVAAHDLTAPSLDELRLAIEICEDLLNYLYELDYKARSMALSQSTKKLFSEKPQK